MTPKDFHAYCEVMREFGVATATIGDCQIVMAAETPKTTPIYEAKDSDEDIKHKIEEVKSVMQLGDEELMNRMFPEETEESVQ